MTVETPVRPPTTAKPGLLHRVSGWAMRHAGLSVLLWVLVLVGVTVASQLVGNAYKNDTSLPGTESQRVIDTFREHQPQGSTESIQIVLHDDAGLAQAATKSRITTMLAEVRDQPHVADVTDPFTSGGSVSADGKTAYSTVALDVVAADMPAEDVRTIVEKAQTIDADGLQVELGGDLVRSAVESGGGASEGAGILAALVILVFLFGSLLAATLPLLTALFAVGSTLGLLVLASHLFTVPDYTAPVMMLVGLGVGIDYALLIFSRYRSELLKGAERPRAAEIALDTAGRSVMFAGCTVVIALLGLLALGLGALQGVALGVTLTVLMTMLATVSLLPALLTLFGKRIERSVRKHAAKARRNPGDGWRKLASLVQKGPWVPLILGPVALVALCLPALDMRLGFADAGTDDPAKTTRKAYDLLAEGFGPGFNGPLIVVSEGNQAAADALNRKLAADPGIAAVTPPQLMPDGKVATVIAFPKSAPQDEATSDLVRRLRDTTLPALEQETKATYLVGGSTAAADDFADAVSNRLPIFVLVVVGLSALLLLAVFRSVLIPLKAAILNLLSIGASLGVITLVFQQGWFGAQPGPIEAFVPVMIFAIVFGLSMDYEVFLISRIHEEWRRTGDAKEAVREGLANTGSVITAAAAIMIVVFGAFLLSPDRMLNQFGLGLATAVLIDALLIRCVIVPAVLRLLGNHAWWLPSRLERVLPKIALERDHS
ncbi:RND superfamily putative drug exporter [Kribbella sp. VKM Ac-2527]|uniref:RND superfamily putative drug exporter n=1 Tax=Kribbella caucasensis TaxID=2512215 RepID=A0A4R6KTL9_9ACTN|nr:MMPL family transporter [Kribbella sp. VKM Ac-2527]TDO54868.1 RND superfamily putative drug exporter [Kribbella sp. VKM Ac-2527]